MKSVTLTIDGMRCPMCEAHVCDAIRRALPQASKVKANHHKNEATFRVDDGVDYLTVIAPIEATGYHVLNHKEEPAKKGFFR